jgi:hypothetical protein
MKETAFFISSKTVQKETINKQSALMHNTRFTP